MEKMNKIKILTSVLIALALLAIGMTVEAGLINNQQQSNSISKSTLINRETDQASMFTAEVEFILLIDDGCGCRPIVGASVFAGGSEGWDEGITDEDGYCVIPMEINDQYTINIVAEDFHEVRFEFTVLDDQTYTFLLTEDKTSNQDLSQTPRFANLNKIIQSIFSS